MKALVLGGAGAMYSETTRDLVNTSNFTEITMHACLQSMNDIWKTFEWICNLLPDSYDPVVNFFKP